jgi:hypothetical protein
MNDHTPEQEDFGNLYRRAFAEYGTQALWKHAAHTGSNPWRRIGDHEGIANARRHGWAAFGGTD